MDRILLLLKRKPGLTFDEFQHHYETSHALLGERFFGHLFKSYRRNYIPDGTRFANASAPLENAYDCITELIFKDAKGSEEFNRIASNPEVRRTLMEDEERFLDRSVCSNASVFSIDSD